VNRSQWPSTYDRDIDLHPPGASSSTEPIDPYRRLVANPLLTVAVVVAAIFLIRIALEKRALPLFLASIGLVFGSVLLVQFHCLDCGATGWMLRAGRHACPALLARWREGRGSRWRFPGLKTQMLVWIHLLASVTGLLLILFALSR
jgi:hypothetical protein